MAILQRGCCCQLRTCVLVLGWLCTVLAVIALGYYAYLSTVDCNDFANTFASKTVSYRTALDACESTKKAIYVGIFMEIVWLVVSILLLVGTYKENRYLLIPYMIGHSVMLVYFVISVFIQAGSVGWTTQLIGMIIGVCIGAAISVYILLCVVSHYQNLRDGEVAAGAKV